MLTHIHIRHFAIIDELSLELYSGMTVMTGETGAGKSIMIDALSLCMGDRAEPRMIREGAERAEISVTIDLSRLPALKQWLTDQEILVEDEVIVRRTISRDGRSRAYINGQLFPLTQLKIIAQDFIDIHSQHAHHALLKPETHRDLLDIYGKNRPLALEVKQEAESLRSLQNTLKHLRENEAKKTQEMDFLQFQIQELETVHPQANEWEQLSQRHDKLSHAQTLSQELDQAYTLLAETVPSLGQLKHKIEALQQYDASLGSISTMLNEAKILCSEASDTLRNYLNSLDSDPRSLEKIDERLSILHTLARKHRCDPEALLQTLNDFQEKIAALQGQEEQAAELEVAIQQAQLAYEKTAAQLIEARKKAAQALSLQITEFMQQLGMPGGEFSIEIQDLDVVFLVKTNAGQKAHPLHKVASGGELSRISLALQVSIVQDDTLPVIVFDEVDVGIGGGTAEIVGHLLRNLGKKAQVLCVTHLPQVAAQGDHHFHISKKTEGDQTRTQVTVLTPLERIDEIARMLGGLTITETTRSHAKEMLGL
jgi:DNA repair protein RecN (Recombination protein N)